MAENTKVAYLLEDLVAKELAYNSDFQTETYGAHHFPRQKAFSPELDKFGVDHLPSQQ